MGAVTGSRPGAPYALDGKNVVIAQWELRPDTCHPDFQGLLNSDGSVTPGISRVRYGVDTDPWDDTDCTDPSYDLTTDVTVGDHATHVAGTMVGNGSMSAGTGALERASGDR